MATLNAGSSVTLTLTDNDSITVVTPGVVTVTGSAGKIGEFTGSRTLGPYAAGSVTLVATVTACEYEMSDGAKVANANLSYDSAGNIAGLAGPDGTRLGLGNSHVQVCIMGDSISARTIGAGVGPAIMAASAVAPWNWANWLIGAPFVYSHSNAVSGDTAKGIFSRVSSVPSHIQAVFVMAGTNDVQSMSSVANQATIDSTYTSVSGSIQTGINALLAAGKVVVISTIIPNNGFSSASDSRIQLLDRLNAFIATLAQPNRVLVVDGFTALWDSAQPALRVAVSGAMNADNVHPTSRGAQLFGAAAGTALKAAYKVCTPDADIYRDFHQVRPLFSEFRRSTGGAAGTISAGSGTIADGWRILQNAGTATFTVDATEAYAPSSDFVGHWARLPVSAESYWQTINITAAAANDNPRLRIPGNDIASTGNALDGIFPGDLFFVEFEVMVSSPVNVSEVSVAGEAFFTAGTAPADQPYYASAFARSIAGTGTDSGSAATAVPSGYRAVLRSPVHRVPENLLSTTTLTMIPYVDIKFNGAGSAIVKVGRPRIWRRAMARIG